MRWFSGPIQDAIATAKHDQKIFLVFVEGKDDASKGMGSKITESSISDPIDENCVSIKLTTDSEPFRQFSQIYPVIVVPSMFLIGDNGIPLEVIAGSNDNDEELSVKVHKAIQLHKSKLSSSGATTSVAPTAVVSPQKVSVPQNESPAASCSLPEDKPEQEGAAGDRVSDSESEEARAHRLLKEKLERAEVLIEERRKIREKEEKEAERQREMEQRRVSRDMLRAREQMKEKEMADWAKERQKEKQADKAARERVLAQIAQDKADRAAKFQYSGSSPPPMTIPSNESGGKPELRQRTTADSPAQKSQVARIQFRLPNATSATHEFPSESTLQDVIRHVTQVIRPGFSDFSLATTFPRRHFARSEYSRTLEELQLTPTCVLLVLPKSRVFHPKVSAVNPINQGGGSGLVSLLWTLISPITFIWNIISSFVFGSGSHQNTTQPPPTSSSSSQGSNPETQPPSTSQSGPRPSNTNAGGYRRDGNVHRLSNESSNEDEDGTWNGNSTQQM